MLALAMTFEQWSQQAVSDDPGVRRSAAFCFKEMLSQQGRKVAPMLSLLLKDPVAGVRREAARSSLWLQDARRGAVRESIAAAILPGLCDSDPWVRAYCAGALLYLGADREAALAVLKPLASDSEPGVRGAAVLSLGNDAHADDMVVALVVGALENADDSVRCAAAHALAKWWGKGTDAVPALVRGLTDPNPVIRSSFSNALVHVTSENPLDLDSVILLLCHEDPSVRRAGVSILQGRRRASSEEVRLLITAAADPDRNVRRIAANALANNGWRSLKAIPVLWRAHRAESNPVARWLLLLSMERILIPWFGPLTALTVAGLLLGCLACTLVPRRKSEWIGTPSHRGFPPLPHPP